MLVVGGGITGAGVALDAATRGLRTALVDKGDFASGTSSKSSKLVHGGIRYLQQKEVGLVYEALAERQMLRKTAPHLVRVLPFLLPVFTTDGLLPRQARPPPRRHDVDVRPHRRAAHRQAAQARLEGRGARLHADAAGRPARGVVRLLRRAGRRRPAHARRSRGPPPTTAPRSRTTRRSSGSRRTPTVACTAARVVADGADDRRPRARSSSTRPACGPTTCARSTKARTPTSIRPAKGIHITVPWSLVQNQIAAVDAGAQGPALGVRRAVGRRGRRAPVHLHRHHRHRLRRPARRSADARPTTSSTCSRAINASVTTTITEADILGTWAGLRPLVRDGEERAHRRPVAPPLGAHVATSGVVTVTGGKLTTYRRMAADAVDEVDRARSAAAAAAAPSASQLHGAAGLGRAGPAARPRRRATAATRASVLALARDDPTLGEPLVPGLAVHAAPRPSTRRATRWRARSTTCSPAAPGPGCSPATRRPTPPTTSPTLMAAELGWDDAEQRPPGRSTTVRSIDAERHDRRAARDRARRARCNARRSADSPARPHADEPGRAHAADRVRGRRGGVGDRARRRTASRSTTRSRERSRRTGADVSPTRADDRSEASRDWWPLAMIWALDDQVAARGRAWSCARTPSNEVGRGPARVQRRARAR